MMDDNQRYRQWVADRQRVAAPDGFADRVMAAAGRRPESEVRQHVLLRLLVAAVTSRPGKFTACCFAFLLGISPFLYLVYLAQSIGVSAAAGPAL